MGNDQPKNKKNYGQPITKQQFEIACIKVKCHLELQRDRRINQALQKEKGLVQLIQGSLRNKMEEEYKIQALVSDINFVEACKIVIRYSEILKERAQFIIQNQQKPEVLAELLVFVESIIWSSNHLNINVLQEFKGLMMYFFGTETINVQNSDKVDPELKRYLTQTIPDAASINKYMISLSKKTGIPLEIINQSGHNFSETLIVVGGQQVTKSDFQPQQPPNNNHGNQPPFQGGGGGGGYYYPPNEPININIQVQPNQGYPPFQGGVGGQMYVKPQDHFQQQQQPQQFPPQQQQQQPFGQYQVQQPFQGQQQFQVQQPQQPFQGQQQFQVQQPQQVPFQYPQQFPPFQQQQQQQQINPLLAPQQPQGVYVGPQFQQVPQQQQPPSNGQMTADEERMERIKRGLDL